MSLSFASGVMFTLSIFELIPESFKSLIKTYKLFPACIIFLIGINIGIIISLILDKKIKLNNNSLYKVGIITMIAIIIHNIPEGIITYIVTKYSIKSGIDIALAIALHNIPEGISIAMPIYYSTRSKNKAFLYTLVSAMAEPFGALIAHIFFRNISIIYIIGIFYAIIAGLMIYISIFELLEEAISNNNKIKTIIFFILGSIVMYISIKYF